MRFEDLEAFLVVSQHANLHRAASELGVTQSGLSKMLARLEAEAGMPLFERTPRGLVLTSIGRTMHTHARKISLAASDMHKELTEQRLARTGTVRLGAIPYLIPSLLSPLLAQFFDSRPLAVFSIETHLSDRLMAVLQNGDADLILAARPASVPEDISGLPLGPLTMQIAARSGHPRRELFHTLADLTEERWAVPASSLYLRQWLEERFTAAGLPPPRVAVESTASPVAFGELLRHSDLLGIMPPRILKQAEGQELAAIEGAGMSWQHELAIFWRDGGYLSPICQDFRDAVVKWCEQTDI
ncbi:transcriptional regulator LysR family (plasmid) [Cupriavidus necator N-1]|uniref:Transcriptional regulator LysR family n=1 Tax=Cupriavidus necator (strain ATCC 43291 / DSM 13513 / CCUG 52238 / LMG 8453 / N-1) TaxID=1042878 RepID=F8GUC1_CUPNN|nr:LysR family transcriptional regulator [Cupriavidus necator]AEI82325.1 transcriptional regulator LysR family [Cupriavidus necator N-1]MDX6007341.1 LysR family transcriptional regulator [Cupriavidus necator]